MDSDKYLEKYGGSFKEIVRLWAPINYQYISLRKDEHKIKMDLLCQVNFPSSLSVDPWDTSKVRERLRQADFSGLVPCAYYSVAATDSHYFILYSFYHADDTTHPNDLEGCLIILERDDVRPRLLGMITVAHQDFVPYVHKESMEVKSHPDWQRRFEMDAEEEPEGDNVLIQQEDGKHGLYALGENANPFTKLTRRLYRTIGKCEDVIIYYPGEYANSYTVERLNRGKGTPYNPALYYKMIDILDDEDGLWKRYQDVRSSGGNVTFTKDGAFHNGGLGGQAKGPWLWRPGKLNGPESEVESGAMWNDPAGLISKMFATKGKPFSMTYLKRMYDR